MVTHDPMPFVLADEMQLTQLFQNVIGNGIKYQEKGNSPAYISPPSGTEERNGYFR